MSTRVDPAPTTSTSTPTPARRLGLALALVTAALLALAACSGDSGSSNDASNGGANDASEGAASEGGAGEGGASGIRVVSPQDGADILNQVPEGLVVLDVRTPEEYEEGHLEGAVLVDFYAADFADQLGQLDPNVPYLLYCRSGNRSGQTRAMMADLGFTDVADVEGGITAWAAAGLPLASP